MRKREFSEEQINKIINLYVNKGYSCRKIGKIICCGGSTIIRLLKRNNINLQERFKLLDMTGQIFGKWKVLELNKEKLKRRGARWVCKCECGTIKILRSDYLRRGNSKSCGCDKAEKFANRKRKYEPWISSAKSVHREVYADGGISFEEFLKLSKMNCHYCGKTPSNTCNIFKKDKRSSNFAIQNGNFIYNGLDRVNSNKLHSIDNVVPCCRQCNVAKSDYSIEEFRNMIINIYNNYICQTNDC